MARCVGVSLLLLAAGRAALPADTGMLYVKSDPPGATVVIGGVERGRTPVLLKNLSAGETEITLRIEGAKPVTVRETVEANKVTTVSADIDVPGASLTVISDPLEAMVYLDKRDRGKTPITIDGLIPGEHALLLLKAGFPRTTRSVVLAAGEERVLEIKLGSAEEDEEARPAADPVARPALRIPEAAKNFLGRFLELTDSGDYAGAHAYAERSAREKALAEFRGDIVAAGEVAKILGGRMVSARRGAQARVGKEVELVTKTGRREGRVKAVNDEGITLVKEIRVGGRAVGGSTSKLAWADLAPATIAGFATDWSPEGVNGALAQALAARAQDDAKGVTRALEGAGDDLLAQYLRRESAAAAAEADARSTWLDIEKRASTPNLPGNETKDLLRQLREFRERHGSGPFAASLGDRVDKTRARLERALDRIPRIPADAVVFRGRHYRLYSEAPLTWDNAREFCERQRGHLVTITSREEAVFVGGLFRGAVHEAWVGLTDVRREGRWEWVTGERFAFALWGRNEPNNMGGNQDHVRVVVRPAAHGDSIGRLDDSFGSVGKPFICEWEPPSRK